MKSAQSKPDVVHISIEDTGTGIDRLISSRFSGRFAREKSLVPKYSESRRIRPTFQRAILEATFASSSPAAPAKQFRLYRPLPPSRKCGAISAGLGQHRTVSAARNSRFFSLSEDFRVRVFARAFWISRFCCLSLRSNALRPVRSHATTVTIVHPCHVRFTACHQYES